MLQLSAFASLAQFGAGLGLALTFFLEPITARSQKFRTKLDSEFSLIPNDGSAASGQRTSEVWLKVIKLDSGTKLAITKSKRPMALIQTGCVVNLIILLLCTIAPEGEVSFAWMCWLLFGCVVPIFSGSFWLVCIAQKNIPDPN
jgi:hypothetical protein